MTADGGDCYQANGQFIIDKFLNRETDIDNWVLVHGKVKGAIGSPVEGLIIDHAWIEDKAGRVFMDMSNGKTIVSQLYKIKDRVISKVRYTPKEVAKNLLKHEHWGGWKNEKEN